MAAPAGNRSRAAALVARPGVGWPRRGLRGAAAALMCSVALAAAARPASADAGPLGRTIAVWRIDALGIDAEIVARLESLFRTELERLAGRPVPSRRVVDRALAGRPRLRACDGSTACLAAIGRRVGADWIVSGNVAQLGDSYVVNLKLIDVATATELRRVASEPLRGTPDELIERVRVAAYRLCAPERLWGEIAVLTDLVGAVVEVDGKSVGTTPLPGPIDRVPLGAHTLRVTAPGFTPFQQRVVVRFQKTTRVVVHLVKVGAVAPASGRPPRGAPPPAPADRWVPSPWLYVAAGVTAALLGGYIGYRLAHDEVIDCSAEPTACR
ncbi:MAG: PEGA domain-containing protein [Deltaproteobacteria bacterium]|nr:MAG: PEGA domain-containing protein [Deltaproteobacteria bacterium]